MKRRAVGVLFFLLFSVSSAFAFETLNLPNQTKLILKPETSHEIVALQCFMPGLLNHEPVSKSGLVQLTLEAMLKGTKHKSEKEIFSALEQYGGQLNVSLSRDFGLITLISTKDQFEKDLELFLEVLKHPAFKTAEIKKLKDTLLQNQKSRLEDPFTVALDELQKNLYPQHPYGRLLLGNKNTLSSITPKEVSDFYLQAISKTPLIISIAGNFNAPKIQNKLKNALAGWGNEIKNQNFVLEKISKNKVITIKQPANAVNFLLAYPAPNASSPDLIALQVLNNILGGKSSSRIFSQIREAKGLGYSLGSFYPMRKEPSHFVLYITVDPKAKKQFPELFLKIVNDLKNKPVSPAELLAAQVHLKSKFLMDHQTTSQRAWYLGLYETMGLGVAFDESYPAQIEKITAEDLQRVSKKYLTRYVLVRQEP